MAKRLHENMGKNNFNKISQKHGGARKGAGAKPKFAEKTTTLAFRCPISKATEFRQAANEILKQWKVG